MPPRPRLWLLVALAAALVFGGCWAVDVALDTTPLTPPLSTGEPPDERLASVRNGFLAPPTGEPTPPDIKRFFVALAWAEAERKPNEWVALFDAERLAMVMREAALGRASAARGGLSGRAREALRSLATAGGLGLAGATVRVVAVQPLPGGTDVIACARHDTATGSAPFRWWLTRQGDGYAAYDAEDVRFGLRLSEQLAHLAADPADEAERQKVAAAVDGLRNATRAVTAGDLNAAEAALATVRADDLPRPQRIAFELTAASVALGRGRPTDAEQHAIAAVQLRPGLPAADLTRAAARLQQGRFADAERFARRYADEIGPDPQAAVVRGTALLRMNRPSEAVRELEAAHREFPGVAAIEMLLCEAIGS